MTSRARQTSRSTKASPAGDHDPLALSKVMPHHRTAWRVERIGWAVMAVALATALLGGFGDGILSRARTGHAGLAVEYQRLQRASAPTEYRFDIDGALARDGTLRLRFDQALIDDIELDSITPAPASVIAGAGHTDFLFDIAPGSAKARITFRFRPATFGYRAGRIATPGAPPLEIDQYIYP